MFLLKPCLSLAFFFLFIPLSSQGLSCKYINDIQNQFLRAHILYSNINPQIKKRVLKNFVKNLDREKIYFLKSDIKFIESQNYNFLKNIQEGNCSTLYKVYDIYSQRVKERLDFAKKYLNNNFQLQRDLVYVLDEDKKHYPRSTKQANKVMVSYLQYQVANIFLIEKNLKKSIEHLFHILNNVSKQASSWKPQLTPEEIKTCKIKRKKSFSTCKPTMWYSLYLNAFAHSLDSHSSYLNHEELESFYISMNLSLEGIGASLRSRFGYIIVEHLVPGGAAFKSKKIRKKDKILAVGQSRRNLIPTFGESIDDVVTMIRGKKGTPVYLKILRESAKGRKKIFIVKLVRTTVELSEEAASITYVDKKRDGKKYRVGIIKVPSFYSSGKVYGKSVSRDVKKLIKEAKEKKISALVLDLSNNRGGFLDEAVDLVGLFIGQGNVVKQTEKNYHQALFSKHKTESLKQYRSFYKKPILLKDRDRRIFYNGPLVILVNRLSASASEIVSGTLQDYNRALIVGGDHTYGKGSVQSVEHLRENLGALKTTVGLYFIPSGKTTQKQGVISDIPLPSIFNLKDIGEKSLDYTLPEQTIPSFKSPNREIFAISLENNWKPVFPKTISKIKNQSKKRVVSNKEFQKIIKRTKEIELKAKNQKTITVGEVLDKKQNDKDLLEFDEDEDTYNPKKKKERYLKRADVQEAVNIVLDLDSFYKKTAALNSSEKK